MTWNVLSSQVTEKEQKDQVIGCRQVLRSDSLPLARRRRGRIAEQVDTSNGLQKGRKSRLRENQLTLQRGYIFHK